MSIQPPRETWTVINISNIVLEITDLPDIPKLKPSQSVDLLSYYDQTKIGQSTVLANYISKGLLSEADYLHTHDDKANVGHFIATHGDTDATGTQLNTLTSGENSDASSLHTHTNKANLVHTHTTKDITDWTQYYETLEILAAWQDSVTATPSEINQALDGIDSTVTYTNLNTLTDTSNADSLHVHKHNSLTDMQGGTTDEYYHLTSSEYSELSNWIDSVVLYSDGSMDIGGGTITTTSTITANLFLGPMGTQELISDTYIDVKPSGDNDDYLRFQTISNVPELTTVGSCDLKLTASSGNIDFDNENLTTTGLGTFGNLDVDTLNLNGNTISDSTGDISFSDENLTTTGTITGNSFTDGTATLTGGDLTGLESLVVDNVQIDGLTVESLAGSLILQSDSGTIMLNSDNITTTGLGTFGNLDVDTLNLNGNTISDSTGDISFSDENLTTTGLGTFGNLDVDTLNLNGNVISDSTGTISFSDENLTTSGNINIDSDASKLFVGDGQDASIYYDGTDMQINPKNVGTGSVKIDGDVSLLNGSDLNLYGSNANVSINFYNTAEGAATRGQLVYRGDLGDGSEYFGFFNVYGSGGMRFYNDTSDIQFYQRGANTTDIIQFFTEDAAGSSRERMRIGNKTDEVDILIGATSGAGYVTNLYLYDNCELILGSGKDTALSYNGTDLNLVTDNVAASDFVVDCGTNKTIELTEEVWDDLRIVPGSFDRPGISDPDLVAYDVNGGGVNTYLYEFEKNDIASFSCQIPHKYKEGENILVHIHWTPGPNGAAENGNTVGWKIDYSWANIDGTFPTMSTADLSDTCDGTDHKHQRTPEVSITGTGKTISSMLICNVKRTDTGADDTWAGTSSGDLPMLLEIDFHFPIDTIGSRTDDTK